MLIWRLELIFKCCRPPVLVTTIKSDDFFNIVSTLIFSHVVIQYLCCGLFSLCMTNYMVAVSIKKKVAVFVVSSLCVFFNRNCEVSKIKCDCGSCVNNLE
jgi:hypothetical protein